MFYILSKLFWPLLMPLTHIFIGIFSAGILIFSNKIKAAKVIMAFILVYFTIFAVLPVGHNLLVYLERQNESYTKPGRIPPYGMVFLGGGMDATLTFKHQQAQGEASFDRIDTFLSLIRDYDHQNTRFVFSGGGGALPTTEELISRNHKSANDFTESDAFAFVLMQHGLDPNRVIFESKSRNTFENALMTKALLTPNANQEWRLVTSAYHMPRALASFKAAGWENIKPYATDYKTNGHYLYMPSFNMLENITFSHLALREIFGNMIYFVTGKSERLIL